MTVYYVNSIAPANAVIVSWLYRKMVPFQGTHVNIFSSKVVVAAKNCQIVQQEKNTYKNNVYISLYRYVYGEGEGKVNKWEKVYCILVCILALPPQFKIFQNNKLEVMTSMLLGVWGLLRGFNKVILDLNYT